MLEKIYLLILFYQEEPHDLLDYQKD